jgi:hypothetical protein
MRRLHLIGWRVLLAIVLSCGGKSVAAANRDYTAAFGLLKELGYPDVRGGQLVRVEAGYSQNALLRAEQAGESGDFRCPSGWLMETPTNGPAVLIDLFGRRLLLLKARGSEGEDEYRGGSPDSDGGITCQWTNVPAAASSSAMRALLSSSRETGQTEGESDPFLSSRKRGGNPGFPMAAPLFFAAGLHQNGLTNEAAALAAAALDAAPDPEAYLAACIAVLADSAYQAAFQRFKQGGAWVDFAADLKSLRLRYGKRWMEYDEAFRLEQAIANRIELAAALPSGDFPPWALACLRQLLADTPVDNDFFGLFRNTPWILAPPPDPGAPVETNPVYRLLDGGMASVPLLIAISTNPTPLRLFGPSEYGYQDRALSVFESVHDPERYHSSSEPFSGNRPMTLGDFAKALLDPLTGRQSDPFSAGKDDSYRAWYEACTNKTRMQLFADYLREGNSGEALWDLLLAESRENPGQVEKMILEFEPVTLGMGLAAVYAGKAPADRAAAFRKAYSAKVRALEGEPVADADPELFVSESRGGREDDPSARATFLKTFEEQKGEEAPPDLKALLDNPTNLVVEGEDFKMALRKTEASLAVALLTNAIGKASSPKLAETLVQHLVMLNYIKANGPEGDAEPEVKPALGAPWRNRASWAARRSQPRRTSAGESAILPACSLEALSGFWRTLLTDTRTNGWEAIPKIAAGTMESLYATGDDGRGEWGAANLLGDEYGRILIARNLDRVEGRDMTDLPALKDIKAVDCTVLEKKLMAAPDPEFYRTLETLDVISLCALSMSPLADPRLVLRLSNTVSRVIEAPPGCGVEKGACLTTNDMVRLVDALGKETGTGTVSLVIERKPRGGGTVIRTMACSPPIDDWSFRCRVMGRLFSGKKQADSATLMFASLQMASVGPRHVGSESEVAYWMLPEAVSPARPGVADDLDAEREDEPDEWSRSRFGNGPEVFWAGAGSFCAATNAPLAPASIRVYRIPVKALKAASEGEPAGFSRNFRY